MFNSKVLRTQNYIDDCSSSPHAAILWTETQNSDLSQGFKKMVKGEINKYYNVLVNQKCIFVHSK